MQKNQNFEIEYKTLLYEKEYISLKSLYFNNQLRQEQVNYYFDTSDLYFFNNKKMVRIRHNITKNYFELCLKKPHDGFIIENNELIDEKTFFSYHQNGFLIENKSVYYITNLKTIRYEFETKNGTLFLDMSYYGNNIDYELEFEAKSKNEEDKLFFINFLKQNNIEYKKLISKSKRAIIDKFKK